MDFISKLTPTVPRLLLGLLFSSFPALHLSGNQRLQSKNAGGPGFASEQSVSLRQVTQWTWISFARQGIWVRWPPRPLPAIKFCGHSLLGCVWVGVYVHVHACVCGCICVWKEGRVSLQWLNCRFIFHLTVWRDDRIPSGGSRESHSPPPLLDRGPHILLTHREVRWVHCFKRWRCLTLRENCYKYQYNCAN